MQRANQRVPQIDSSRQVAHDLSLTCADDGQLATPRLLPSPPVGSQVVQGPPEVPLRVARDPPSLPDQPLKRCLQQVFAVLPTAGQQHCRPHQLGAAFGQQQLEGVSVLSFLHAITSHSHLASTKEEVDELSWKSQYRDRSPGSC